MRKQLSPAPATAQPLRDKEVPKEWDQDLRSTETGKAIHTWMLTDVEKALRGSFPPDGHSLRLLPYKDVPWDYLLPPPVLCGRRFRVAV